jgi:hypothetical protein
MMVFLYLNSTSYTKTAGYDTQISCTLVLYRKLTLVSFGCTSFPFHLWTFESIPLRVYLLPLLPF